MGTASIAPHLIQLLAQTKHTLVNTEINYGGGSHCSGHNDPNKVIGLWVTVTGPSQVIVTLIWGNNPYKVFFTQKLVSILVGRQNYQSIRSCTSNSHPTHIPNSTLGTACAIITRKDMHPTLHSCSYCSVSYIAVPIYLTDILSSKPYISSKSQEKKKKIGDDLHVVLIKFHTHS